MTTGHNQVNAVELTLRIFSHFGGRKINYRCLIKLNNLDLLLAQTMEEDLDMSKNKFCFNTEKQLDFYNNSAINFFIVGDLCITANQMQT